MSNISLRPHQEYVVNKITRELDKHNIFFINMSTGGGKTLTSLLIYKMMREQSSAKCLIATRTLHSPDGSFNYKKKVTIPEHGICLEILTHLAIDVDGNVSVCVRFDPLKKLVIGNVKKQNQTLLKFLICG